jgi:hypothetical protein
MVIEQTFEGLLISGLRHNWGLRTLLEILICRCYIIENAGFYLSRPLLLLPNYLQFFVDFPLIYYSFLFLHCFETS